MFGSLTSFPPARLGAIALASSLALMGLPAHADERSDLEQLRATTMALMQALIDNGLLSKDKAEDIVRQAQRTAPAPATAQTSNADAASADKAAAEKPKPNVIRIPYITEAAKAEIRDQVKQEVLAQAHDERWGEPGALPDWMRRITVSGDVRVRFQDGLFDKNNMAPDAPNGYLNQIGQQLAWSPDLANTQHDRDRMTLRARLALSSDLGGGVSTGIRLTTGTSGSTGSTSTTADTVSGPATESPTLGNSFNKYSVVLDRAYIQYKGSSEFEGYAGKFANPFFGTDLTWPDDLNFDGVAVAYKPALSAGNALAFSAGAFPLLEFETSTKDKWLYGAQAGGSFNLAPHTQMRVGLAAYKFSGLEGVPETTIPPSGASAMAQPYLMTEYKQGLRMKGNTLYRINQYDDSSASVWGLASKFTPINLSAELKFTQFYPFNIRVSLDYVNNVGFDINEIRRRTNNLGTGDPSVQLAKQNSAYQAKVTIGADQIDDVGQWQSSLTFRRLERDAWVDAFTDMTWNLGGTNYQGWSLGGQYGVAKQVTLGLRWTSTRNLPDSTVYTDVGTGFAGNSLSNAQLKIDVLQIELNARF